MIMLEYFVTSLIVHHLFILIPAALLLFTVPTSCCKRKKQSKSKHKKHRKGGKKRTKHSTTGTTGTTVTPITTTLPTPITPITPIPTTPTPVMFTPKVAQTPLSTESADADKQPIPPLASNKSKEAVVVEKKDDKKSDKEEDVAELLRCRDYTPENFGELKWLFDLLD